MLAALVPHQSVIIHGVCNSLAVGSWGGLRYRSLHWRRKELYSTRWAGNSLVLTAGSACCPRSDSGTMKSLSLEAEAALTLPSRGLCFAQHLLHVLQAQYKVACQDLLQAAATAPMHGMAPAGQGREQLLQQLPGSWSRPESWQDSGHSSLLMPHPCLGFPVLALPLPCTLLTLFTILPLSHASCGLRQESQGCADRGGCSAGAITALRRCLLQVPEVAVSMQTAELVQSWQELLTRLVTTVRDITSLLLGALQSQQGPGADEQGECVPMGAESSLGTSDSSITVIPGPGALRLTGDCRSSQGPAASPSHCPTQPCSDLDFPFAAAAPSFAEMGNAIGSLIMLGKGRGQEEEEGDSILLSEEHSLILTCCWVSVKVRTPLHGTGRGAAQHGTWHPSSPPLLLFHFPLGHSFLGMNMGEFLCLPQCSYTCPHRLPGRMQLPGYPKAGPSLPALTEPSFSLIVPCCGRARLPGLQPCCHPAQLLLLPASLADLSVFSQEIGLLLGGLAELLLSPALPAELGPFLPLPTLQTATRVFQEILLRCRHWVRVYLSPWASLQPCPCPGILGWRGGKCSGAGSPLGQEVGMAGDPVAGIPVPDPITSLHHHVFSFALHKEFSGVTGGWCVQPLGCLS